jgi:hypothetical protein
LTLTKARSLGASVMLSLALVSGGLKIADASASPSAALDRTVQASLLEDISNWLDQIFNPPPPSPPPPPASPEEDRSW